MTTPSYNWQARREKKAFLALADGSVFRGWSFGADVDVLGEVVFNTGMAATRRSSPIPPTAASS